MIFRGRPSGLLALVLLGGALAGGCASQPDANLATGASNAGIDESKYPKTIGPEPASAPPKVLPKTKPMTKGEQIAEVKRRKLPPRVSQRMLEVIERLHGKDTRKRVRPPADRAKL
ncbi:hypothetical protein EON77_08615 [bacterium]|nr:MAG: hypothetical protein EON77_08615 [bacterium]